VPLKSESGWRPPCPYCEVPLRADPDGVTVQLEQGVLFVAMSCSRCNTAVELVAGITDPLAMRYDNEVAVQAAVKVGSL
jgi:hypothetical protein